MSTAYMILFILIAEGQTWKPQPERFDSMTACSSFKKEFMVQDWNKRQLENLWRSPWDQLEPRAGFCCAMKDSGSVCQTTGGLVAENR
jgi:hypothetical protein